MRSRYAAGVLAALLAVTLTGCTGASPRPSPTPTPPFASADDAYRAAEATYRAYVDAGNHVDLQNPKTFEPVYAWLLGDALDTDRTELTAMSAKGWHWSGKSRVTLVQPLPTAHTDPEWGDVDLAACLDVSGVSVTDAGGSSVVAASRPDVQAVQVSLSRDASVSTGMKITRIKKRAGKPWCHA